MRLYAKASICRRGPNRPDGNKHLGRAFSGSGYKQNVWPMQRLAELKPRLLPGHTHPAITCETGTPLGVAGLLPEGIDSRSGRRGHYLGGSGTMGGANANRSLIADLPGTLALQRPPPREPSQRRLALAGPLARQGRPGGPAGRMVCQRATISDTALADSSGMILQVEQDEFWSWHWTLRGKPLVKPQPLIGSSRLTYLAVNVALPWAWARAREGHNEKLTDNLEGHNGNGPQRRTIQC